MLLSLAMIVRDEKDVLARALDGVKDAVDEIVILDTGSVDGTPKLAKRYTNKVFSMPWKDDFSLARNTAFSYCSGDYLMWLDADDIVTEDNAAKLRALKKTLERGQYDLVFCPYVSGGLTYFRERIVKRGAGFVFSGRVHECIAPHGKTYYSDFTVLHGKSKGHGTRNLDIYRKWRQEEPLSGRDLFYYGRELYYHGLYEEGAAVLEKMLSGDGWYVNKIEACRVLFRCFMGMGCEKNALDALLHSFRYGDARAGVCVDLGNYFAERKKFSEARYWYESALTCRDHAQEGDFEAPADRGILPLLQLVVCCHALGDTEAAKFYHEKSEALAPDHPSVIYNKKFFGT